MFDTLIWGVDSTGYHLTNILWHAINTVVLFNVLKKITPDLIIFDLYMEKMDGFKVLMILKSSPKWKDVPIIVFSSHGTQDVIDKVINAGADEFLLKMITSPSKLAQKAKAVLKQKV